MDCTRANVKDESGVQSNRKRPRSTRQTWESCLDTSLSPLKDLFQLSKESSPFWIEHRMESQFRFGDERIIIFRVDGGGRPQVVGKLVYSSDPFDDYNKKRNINGDDSSSSLFALHSTIHALNVKKEFRGCGLGSLLINAYLAKLEIDLVRNKNETPSELIRDCVVCHLEAEEDIRHHGKLVGFYQKSGWEVKSNYKVQYLNNNDGETYRKVPMHLKLYPNREHSNPAFLKNQHFLPVVVSREEAVESSSSWLLFEDNGKLMFQTPDRRTLLALPGGTLQLAEATTVLWNSNWSQFLLNRFNDTLPEGLKWHADKLCHVDDLWLIQDGNGGYLGVNNQSNFFLSSSPLLWRTNRGNPLNLVCTNETPLQRWHHVRQCSTQSVEYILKQKQTYLSFQLAKKSLVDILEMAKTLPGTSSIGEKLKGSVDSSLFVQCFATAEYFNNCGQPDWVQLVAFLYYLGGVVKLLDPNLANLTCHDWTFPTRGWISGCSPLRSVSHPEYHFLNPDALDCRFNNPKGMYNTNCGLDQTLPIWSGPEYMFHFLAQNKVYTIPEEGLKILRFANLDCWHSSGSTGYQQITNEDDKNTRSFVANFASNLERSIKASNAGNSLSEADCYRLWDDRYQFIVSKYGLDGLLQW